MKQRDNRKKGTASDNKEKAPQVPSDRPVITVDYEKYAHFLDDADLTEEQKQEFLQALWSIIVEFVSLGFGVHPLQQAQKSCEQLEENSVNRSLAAPDMLVLNEDILTEKFESAAGLVSDAGAEGVE